MVRKKRMRSEYLESMGSRRTNQQQDWLKNWGQSRSEGLVTLLKGYWVSLGVIKMVMKMFWNYIMT